VASRPSGLHIIDLEDDFAVYGLPWTIFTPSTSTFLQFMFGGVIRLN
jgi:hypothetical protein